MLSARWKGCSSRPPWHRPDFTRQDSWVHPVFDIPSVCSTYRQSNATWKQHNCHACVWRERRCFLQTATLLFQNLAERSSTGSRAFPFYYLTETQDARWFVVTSQIQTVGRALPSSGDKLVNKSNSYWSQAGGDRKASSVVLCSSFSSDALAATLTSRGAAMAALKQTVASLARL